MSHPLLDPQPPPTGGYGDAWKDIYTSFGMTFFPAELWHDMVHRRQQGLERYGTPLRYANGRNAYVDAYQEALDMVAYAQQARAPWWLRWGAVAWAEALRRKALASLPPSG